MREEKNIVLNIILSIITCGIYGIVWFIQMTDEAKEYSEDVNMQSGAMAFLLTLVTCGIYGIYWAYQMGKMISAAQEKNNIPTTDNSVLYLVLQLFGLSIVNYCLMQNELNKVTAAKNGNGIPQQQAQA